MDEKFCNNCKTIKPLNDFHVRKASIDGRTSRCKECLKVVNKNNYNPEYQKRYRKTKEFQIKELKSKYRLEKWINKGYTIVKSRPAYARDILWELFKKSKCVDCGESNPIVLEFDHLKDKSFTISSYVNNSRLWSSKIQEEIDKCEIVCANCHRIRTSQRGLHWRYQNSNHNL
jgi:hypothetical protein